MRLGLRCLWVAALSAALARPIAAAEEFDVVVYGGTSAGVIAAVDAKRRGKSVVLVSPNVHLGGLSSSDLSFTDSGDKSVISGLAKDFYHRIWEHYQQEKAWRWQPRSGFGTAAVQAIDDGVAVQDVSYEMLAERLRQNGQVLTAADKEK